MKCTGKQVEVIRPVEMGTLTDSSVYIRGFDIEVVDGSRYTQSLRICDEAQHVSTIFGHSTRPCSASELAKSSHKLIPRSFAYALGGNLGSSGAALVVCCGASRLEKNAPVKQ